MSVITISYCDILDLRLWYELALYTTQSLMCWRDFLFSQHTAILDDNKVYNSADGNVWNIYICV